MKNIKGNSPNHSQSAFLIIITIVVLATFAVSLATYLKIDSQQMSPDGSNSITGQAQKTVSREQASLSFSPSLDPTCSFIQTSETSYTLKKGCNYPVVAQISG